MKRNRLRPDPSAQRPADSARAPRAGAWIFLPALLLALSLLGMGCATSGTPDDSGASAQAQMGTETDRDERITALKASIDRDHRTLATLVTDAPASDSRRFHANPELRRLADRLEEKRRELDALLRAEAAEAELEAARRKAGDAARRKAGDAAPSEIPTSPID